MLRARTFVLAAMAAALVACGNSTGPAQCTDDTRTVTVTVSGDTPPVFNWDPACSVAHLLIEAEGGSDLWFIFTDDAVWDNPAQANLITPPVTYGILPTGVQESGPPEAVTSGVLQVQLVRVLPAGSAAVLFQGNVTLP